MTTPSTGKLADPDWRRERAAKAGRSRTTIDHYVAKVVERAGDLTDEHVEQLRRLLPEVGEDQEGDTAHPPPAETVL